MPVWRLRHVRVQVPVLLRLLPEGLLLKQALELMILGTTRSDEVFCPLVCVFVIPVEVV